MFVDKRLHKIDCESKGDSLQSGNKKQFLRQRKKENFVNQHNSHQLLKVKKQKTQIHDCFIIYIKTEFLYKSLH